MLTSLRKGLMGEHLLMAALALSSDGMLEMFRPDVDDDHVDMAAGRRGLSPELKIQVKTALTVNRKGLVVARAAFSSGEVIEHPRLIYGIVYVVGVCIATGWIVPSVDFNRLAYRGAGKRGKGVELQFMAHPTRVDAWARFRCQPTELGPRMLALIDGLPGVAAPVVPGAHTIARAR